MHDARSVEIVRDSGARIAALVRGGSRPGIVWLNGLKSVMTGTKAQAVDAWAAERGRACVRFDYFGHGASSGDFRDGTVTRWLDDSLTVIERLCHGPQILVGSSMGAWLAVLSALARPERVAGLLLIAPAVDFTEVLLWNTFSPDVRGQIQRDGEWLRPSQYDPQPYPITCSLIEDGRKHLVLGASIELSCPVRILQGMADPDVPWQHAMKLVDRLGPDTELTLVKAGDHRLSRASDIALLLRTLGAMS
ncbi:MAG TPA: alpha/beta hydrolase [Rhizomicrobium sp.]|nr:alpha/beta hydrolase [Rhizomicrobium sp.]